MIYEWYDFNLYLLHFDINNIHTFQIPRGNAKKFLRCGKKYYMIFVGNLILFSVVEEFCKSVNI